MASLARVEIIGNVGGDAELRMTPNGRGVADFSVAVNQKYGDKETTDWFRVSCWGKLGEIAQQYVKKGGQVYISGRFTARTYTDKTGANRTSLDVSADVLTLLGGKREDGTAAPAFNAESDLPF